MQQCARSFVEEKENADSYFVSGDFVYYYRFEYSFRWTQIKFLTELKLMKRSEISKCSIYIEKICKINFPFIVELADLKA